MAAKIEGADRSSFLRAIARRMETAGDTGVVYLHLGALSSVSWLSLLFHTIFVGLARRQCCGSSPRAFVMLWFQGDAVGDRG